MPRRSTVDARTLFLTLALLAARPGLAAPRSEHAVPATTAAISIDGRLDEPAWADALVLTLDVETSPGDNVAAPVRTECRMVHDARQLYVAFRVFDPEPESIRARLTDRDAAFDDDFVGVVFDTFDDQRRAFEFLVNPLGVQMDLTYDEVNENEDSSWDAIWDSAGRLTADGYVVELAVPFSSLRFQRTAGVQAWGLDVLRNYPRSSRHRLAIHPLDRDVDCYLCQASKIVGFEGITPGHNLEVNPTLTAGRSETRPDFPGGPLEHADDVTDLGVTVAWGVTPNLALSATIEPDFSQIEADVAQLDINTQFALFYPERRPFFLEGADLFDTPLGAVFTRNVADPSWGLKLTGKEGKHAVGVFVAQDDLTNLLFPGDQGSAAGSFAFESTDAVLRYRRDLSRSSTLGALVTHREGDGYANDVAGVDGLVRFSDSDSLRFQALRSRTEYPGAIVGAHAQPDGAFEDHALSLSYVHNDREWRWWGVYDDVGPGFRADMGFLPQVGITRARAGVQRTWWGEEGDPYDRIQSYVNAERIDDAAGRRLQESYGIWAGYRGPRQSNLQASFTLRDRAFAGVEFEEATGWAYFEFRPTGNVFFSIGYEGGDDIDFANVRPGTLFDVEPEIRIDWGRHLHTSLTHELRRLDVDGGRLFEANLTQARVVYQLNLRTFLRAILQYTDIERDPSLYTAPVAEAKTERLFTQLLFSYKLDPRTVLFLGYSDNYRGNQAVDLTQENRAVFLKVGYAWVW